MNTSKFLLAGLTVATLSAAPGIFARDTEAQKKANEALQQKLSELDAQQAAAAPAAPAPAPAKPVAQPAPAPAPAPAPVTAPPQPAAASTPVAAPAPVAVAIEATPTPPEPTPTHAPVPVPPPEDPKVVQAREDALNRTMDKSGGFSEVPPPSNTGNATSAQLQVSSAKASAATSSSAKPPHPGEYKPLVAPPSPLNAAKEAQLAELLRKYRADEITPEQYHIERAKIIGAP